MIFCEIIFTKLTAKYRQQNSSSNLPYDDAAGSGKTTLAHVITDGHPPTTTIHSTAGCQVHLKLLTYPEERAQSTNNSSLAGREFWVELWDVGGAHRYETLRALWMHEVNGVLLVHDLSSGRSVQSIKNWAREVAKIGSFQAPFPEERAALNIGGLPVPCLLVGNKVDLVNPAKLAHINSSFGGSNNQLSFSQKISNAIWRPWYQLKSKIYASFARQSSMKGSSSGLDFSKLGDDTTWLPGTNSKPFVHHARKESDVVINGGLQTAAIAGKVDEVAVNEFLYQLIERRYAAASGIGGDFLGASFNGSRHIDGSTGLSHLSRSSSARTEQRQGVTSAGLRIDDIM